MTEQRIQYCKHFYFFANQGISGCAKYHQYCYYANCPDWEPITVSYTVTITTTNEKVREESWIKAEEEYDMNCKGCIHCRYVGKYDSAYIGPSFHYCDIYPEKETIGKAFKWCEGTSYENKEGKKYFEV